MSSEGDLAAWAADCAKTPGRQWRVRSYEGDQAFEIENRGTFDEVVVDHWLHVEQMDERTWMVRVGDHGSIVKIETDGRVTVVAQSE